MTVDRVHQITAHYRAQLASASTSTQHTLRTAHTQMLHALTPHLAPLYRAIAAKVQAGETVSLSWLVSGGKLSSIAASVSAHIAQFAQTVNMAVGHLLHVGASLGSQAGTALVQAVTNAPVEAANVASKASGIVAHGLQQIATLTSSYAREAASSVRTALIRGVSLGSPVADIAKDVAGSLTTSLWRAVTSAGTFLMDAFRGVLGSIFRDNSNVVIGWIWICSFSHSCAACIAMHGTKHGLDEDLDSHPRCNCIQQPYTSDSPDVQSGSDWFDEQDEETQLEVLGPGKLTLLQSGEIDLADLVGTTDDGSIYEKPLKALVKA